MEYAIKLLIKHKNSCQTVINYLQGNGGDNNEQIEINKERIKSIDELLKFVKDREVTLNFDLNCGAKVKGFIKEWKPCQEKKCGHCIGFKNS